MVWSMMVQANFSISFWRDALLTAANIFNQVPSKSLPFTLFELQIGRSLNLDHLHPLRSAGYVHSSSHRYGKLGPRASKKVFIRYLKVFKRYFMYDEHPNGGMTEIESQDVEFLEHEFLRIYEVDKDVQLYEPSEEAPQISGSITEDNESAPLNRGEPLDTVLEAQPIRQSKHENVPYCHFNEVEGRALICAVSDVDEPASYEEAVASSDLYQWLAAMKEEMDSMTKNEMWVLVNLLSK